jgi:hypothetical protein
LERLLAVLLLRSMYSRFVELVQLLSDQDMLLPVSARTLRTSQQQSGAR